MHIRKSGTGNQRNRICYTQATHFRNIEP